MLTEFVESPRRILFVEDNPADILMLREGFRTASRNDELIVAEDAVQAMEAMYGLGKYAGAPTPDLVLIDSNVSNNKGIGALGEIKADPALRGIPVLMLTSAVTEDDIRRMYEMYCNCVIRKPIDLEGYVETVHEIATFWLRVVRLPASTRSDR